MNGTPQNDPKTLGTETVRWDLSRIYSGLDDPQLMKDVAQEAEMAKAFDANYRGKLKERLGDSIADMRDMTELGSKRGIWLFMLGTLDSKDQAIKAKSSEISKALAKPFAEHLTFWQLEIIALSDKDIERQASHPMVAKHRPYLEDIRRYKPHWLDENVEEALSKRHEFGPGSWAGFYDEVESDLSFDIDGKKMTLTEAFHVMGESQGADKRFAIMKMVNDALGGPFGTFSAQVLWMTAGSKAIEDSERKYQHPMSSANLGNRISDEVVEALHEAIANVAGPICRDWYRLKGEILGIAKLRWSDRNAKLRFEDDKVVPYADAFKTVLDAYQSFSPTLAKLVQRLADEKRIDLMAGPKRESGAYNISGCFPGDVPETFVFGSYLGSRRDAMMMAHEFGHACHGFLAGEAQGALQMDAPMPYAETASVFGEMTAFNHIVANLGDDPKAKLAIVAGKIDDMMNTAVRQIGFSFFERDLHGAGRRLSKEDLDGLWMQSIKKLYGEDGDVFAYGDMQHLWAYIGHFHRPFYVYSYAFGELLTQSLYAVREKFGKDFEPMYLDMLRAGGTKDAVELLKPFGLDPTDPQFWVNGIKNSMGVMTEEARRLWNIVK